MSDPSSDVVERFSVDGSVYENFDAAVTDTAEDRTVAHCGKYGDALAIAEALNRDATIERLSAELERCREALRGKAIAAECKRDLSNTAENG